MNRTRGRLEIDKYRDRYIVRQINRQTDLLKKGTLLKEQELKEKKKWLKGETRMLVTQRAAHLDKPLHFNLLITKCSREGVHGAAAGPGSLTFLT